MPRWEVGGVFDLAILESRPGFIVFRATGKGAKRVFQNEAGGHRWQRIPDTEKRGRVHTSTVTVAVLEEPTASQVHIDPRDVEIKTCRGSGAGGQHRNTTDSAVQATHKPSGLSVRCEGERSQHQNREAAMRLLRARLAVQQKTSTTTKRNKKRKAQVGTGMRADKIRTAALQRDQVTDHRSGKTINSKKYLRGDWDGLF